jgi:hypothetical protein
MPISLAVFAFTKPHRAVAILLIYGAILLPELEFFDIKFLPDMDKSTIACGWAFFPALIWARQRLRRPNLGAVPWMLFGLMVVVDVGRALTNPDTLVIGGRVIPAIMAHTAATFIMKDFLVAFVPFYLGAALFNERETLRDFMRIFATAGLLYVPLVAIELRFSPQLHYWVYGYLQHSWLQVMRDGGYRPMVFMRHGLAVALFMGTCALLSFGLARAKERLLRFKALHAAILLSLVLALSHSLGAFLLLVALTPLVWFMSPRTQLRAAALIGALVMLYPMLRAYDWFPTKPIVEMARAISADRAGSIEFRFRNENILLDRALERPIFGWGGFDRIFVYDQESGDEASTFDGAWLITYAASGVLGFIARFGLLTYPIWRAFKRVRRVPLKSDQLLLSAMGVATAMVSVDLIPNGMFTYFPHLFAGVLLGATRELSRRDAVAPPRASEQAAPGVRGVHAAA